MNTSDAIDELAKALVEFHKAVGKVRKTDKNPFFGSKYASLSTILDAIAEPLATNGLSIVQAPSGVHGLTTMLLHSSGQWVRDEFTMTPVRTAIHKSQTVDQWEITPQTIGSAITYARRYAACAILSLNIDEDDDGNQASRTSAPRSASPAPPTDVTF